MLIRQVNRAHPVLTPGKCVSAPAWNYVYMQVPYVLATCRFIVLTERCTLAVLNLDQRPGRLLRGRKDATGEVLGHGIKILDVVDRHDHEVAGIRLPPVWGHDHCCVRIAIDNVLR